MARTRVTNLVAWGGVTLCVGYLLVPPGSLVLVAGVALATAMFARCWPAALGVAGGAAATLFFDALWSPVLLLAAAAVGGAATVIWRRRASAPAALGAPAPPTAATPRRLTFTTMFASFAVLVVNFLVSLGTGISCDADASPGAPGSDRAAWCDALGNHHVWPLILSLPSAVLFLGGIYAASRGRAGAVLMFVIAGFALVIAVHVPDVVL